MVIIHAKSQKDSKILGDSIRFKVVGYALNYKLLSAMIIMQIQCNDCALYQITLVYMDHLVVRKFSFLYVHD